MIRGEMADSSQAGDSVVCVLRAVEDCILLKNVNLVISVMTTGFAVINLLPLVFAIW